MRIGVTLGLGTSMEDVAAEVMDYEAAGAEDVGLGEAYTFDAVSQLAFIAARTSRIGLATAIMPLYTRTPTLMAMTAAGMDYVSGGRFTLGIGSSGPQVVEGFHGLRFDAPLARTRETIEICRKVWRREKVIHDGSYYQVPLPVDRGSGEGKPLKLINRPVRDRIPITLAAIGPRNVALAAEVAEAWEPIFFYPELAEQVWGEPLAGGRARRAADLDELKVVVRAPFSLSKDAGAAFEEARAQLALYVGGMGSRGHNFYNDLATRYGYGSAAQRVQDLYLEGRIPEAIAAVPDELVAATALIGDESTVASRLSAYATAGVTQVNVTPLAQSRGSRVSELRRLCELAKSTPVSVSV